MDFNGDTEAINQQYQFMFGKSLLVTPITEAGITQQNVYLPKASTWYDFYTGTSYKGGQTIKADAPLDKIPVFVKAGTILPIGAAVQYASEKKWDNLEIRVYEGANGSFTLYEDEGDNYNYEKGAYSNIELVWDDAKKTLTIGERKGSFTGMLAERKFNIVLINKNKPAGYNSSVKFDKEVKYSGKKIALKLK